MIPWPFILLSQYGYSFRRDIADLPDVPSTEAFALHGIAADGGFQLETSATGMSFRKLIVTAEACSEELEQHMPRTLLDKWLAMIDVHEECMEEHRELILELPVSL